MGSHAMCLKGENIPLDSESHTFALADLPINLGENAGVAENHDKQGEDIQCNKVKHVVCRLLPEIPETSVGHTLSEVHSISFNGPKDEQLDGKSIETMRYERETVPEKHTRFLA